MVDQKYCRNCGEPNLPNAAYCANCGVTVASAAASPPGTAPSAQPSPPPRQPPYTPPPTPPPRSRTIFGFSRKMIAVGLVVVVVLLTLGCVTLAMMTPSPTPTPVVERQAVTAAPTSQASPTAAPSAATPTARPTGGVDVDTLNSGMASLGYTITRPFVANGTTSEGYQMYSGMFTKGGVTFGAILVQTDSASSARSYLPTAVSNAEASGFTGSYTDSTTWKGSTIAPSGNTMLAQVGVMNGDQVLILLGE